MNTTEKLEKFINDINNNFGIRIKMLKAGGRWSITLESGQTIESKKMKDIKEYVFIHSEELEEEDDDD